MIETTVVAKLRAEAEHTTAVGVRVTVGVKAATCSVWSVGSPNFFITPMEVLKWKERVSK